MDPSFLLAFPLLLALSTPCSACSCKIQHPQTYYCNSDVVVVADILGPGENTKLKQGLKINITKTLKAPGNISAIDNLYTPLKWDDCGYELRTRFQSHLLIAGFLRRRGLYFTRCHLVYFWHRTTREQRKGFEVAYRTACKCQVKPCLLCWHACPEPDFNECVWKQRNCAYSIWQGDHSLFFMCAPSTSGRCEWTRIQKYYNYQSQAPTTISTITPLILD